MTDSAVQIPGFIAGTWAVDPGHPEVCFTVGHLVVSEVRGRFDAYNGTIVTDEALGHSSADVTIDAASVNTHMPVLDNQVRSADFLGVEHPNITFTSSAIRNEQGHYFIDEDLTIRGTSRPVTLDVTVNGFSPDTFGGTRSSFGAITKFDRADFGVSFNAPVPGLDNAMLPGNGVVLTLDVEAVLQTGANVA
jgi:polyisoprenoid-binding protein YceI